MRKSQSTSLAKPSERFSSWVQNPEDADYLVNKLQEYVRVSREVLSSTFHLHGTVDPKTITEKYIEGGATLLYVGLEKASLSTIEKEEKKDDVRSARADLSEYMARKALNTMKLAPDALGLDDLERIAEEANKFFERSRDRSGLPKAERQRLAELHEGMIDSAMVEGLTHSVALDMTRAKNATDPLSPLEQKMLVQRTEDTIGALCARTLTDNGRKTWEAMRQEICYYSLKKCLPVGQKQSEHYTY